MQDELERVVRHHGHLGGFAVLGYKAGQFLLDRLAAQRYFGMNVVLFCPPQPPHSCMLDGLQLATGCSVGKANLALRASEQVVVRAENLKSGERVWIRPAEGVVERILAITRERCADEAGRWAWQKRPQELWVECERPD